MSFYWVNLGNSRNEVRKNGFLWAPTFTLNKHGTRIANSGWLNVPKVKKSDVIFCHEGGKVLFIGIALRDAYPAPRPEGREYIHWKNEGYKVDVRLEILPTPLSAAEFKSEFIDRYNNKCSPLVFTAKGTAAQNYMCSIPEAAAALILEALGATSLPIQDAISQERGDKRGLNATFREALIKARVGQGKFRQDVLKLWNSMCPLTKVQRAELLIASHIVSWQLSTDEEKIDPFNGIALSPNADKLFDKGLVSFSDRGEILLHNSISKELLESLGISPNSKLESLDPRSIAYIQRHRHKYDF